MYITTFYSFKGGVGRSMALVNVAHYLASIGRKVLVVDFDLEAPGLDTFDLRGSVPKRGGLIEYVHDYLASPNSPDALEYVSNITDASQHKGQLWLMPSGRSDSGYGRRLASIDWASLYADSDGFLMVEDLKAQWQASISPDYVLIDSRTGHTDVGGICTRQLPDSVVVLFFPNDQNLRGIESAVRDIRNEALTPRKKEITVHLVAANVPDLDDEERILARRMELFRPIGATALTIHHYNSLALIEQDIFTRTRPRSRLAHEYRSLARLIMKSNPADREGALVFLRSVLQPSRGPREEISAQSVARRVEDIAKHHSQDGEVLRRLGIVRSKEGDFQDAARLFAQAIGTGVNDATLHLSYAESLALSGNNDAAMVEARSVLSREDASPFEVTRAIRLLRRLGASSVQGLGDVSAIRRLSYHDQLWIAQGLKNNREDLPAAKSILLRLVEEGADLPTREMVRLELSLVLIGNAEFSAAMREIAPSRDAVRTADIAGVFNYAMAEWGELGTAPEDLFSCVVELDSGSSGRSGTANYSQCLAIANWAAGRPEQARRRLAESRMRIGSTSWIEFSAWRYLMTPPADFSADLDEIADLLDGAPLIPVFARRREVSPHGA